MPLTIKDDDGMETFLGYPTFSDTKNNSLKSFNRIITYFNIFKERGNISAKKYMSLFSKEEKSQISNMYSDIKNRGFSIVRLEIQEGRKYA